MNCAPEGDETKNVLMNVKLNYRYCMDGIPSYSLNNCSYVASKWHNQQNIDEQKYLHYLNSNTRGSDVFELMYCKFNQSRNMD